MKRWNASAALLNVGVRIGMAGLVLSSFGCDRNYEEANITVFDYRFLPNRIPLQSGKPFRLVIRNQGRETHRFKSSILRSPGITTAEGEILKKEEIENGLPLHPGKTLKIRFTVPPGQYTFTCPLRGHRGMNGLLFVEEPS